MRAVCSGEEVIKMDDLIIDCFAGGGGASVGIEMALGRHVDIAKENTFEARQRRVAVEVAEFSDNDGEIQGSGNLLGKTDWVKGEFNTKTKTFTPAGE